MDDTNAAYAEYIRKFLPLEKQQSLQSASFSDIIVASLKSAGFEPPEKFNENFRKFEKIANSTAKKMAVEDALPIGIFFHNFAKKGYLNDINAKNGMIKPRDLKAVLGLILLKRDYPEIYGKLASSVDFTNWKLAELDHLWQIGCSKYEKELKDLDSDDAQFSEDWQKIVYCLCANSPDLKPHTKKITSLIDELRNIFTDPSGEMDAKYTERLEKAIEKINSTPESIAVEDLTPIHSDVPVEKTPTQSPNAGQTGSENEKNNEDLTKISDIIKKAKEVDAVPNGGDVNPVINGNEDLNKTLVGIKKAVKIGAQMVAHMTGATTPDEDFKPGSDDVELPRPPITTPISWEDLYDVLEKELKDYKLDDTDEYDEDISRYEFNISDLPWNLYYGFERNEDKTLMRAYLNMVDWPDENVYSLELKKMENCASFPVDEELSDEDEGVISTPFLSPDRALDALLLLVKQTYNDFYQVYQDRINLWQKVKSRLEDDIPKDYQLEYEAPDNAFDWYGFYVAGVDHAIVYYVVDEGDDLFRVRLGFEDKEKYTDLYYTCFDRLKQKDKSHVFKYKIPYIRTDPLPIDEAVELFPPLVAATYDEIKNFQHQIEGPTPISWRTLCRELKKEFKDYNLDFTDECDEDDTWDYFQISDLPWEITYQVELNEDRTRWLGRLCMSNWPDENAYGQELKKMKKCADFPLDEELSDEEEGIISTPFLPPDQAMAALRLLVEQTYDDFYHVYQDRINLWGKVKTRLKNDILKDYTLDYEKCDNAFDWYGFYVPGVDHAIVYYLADEDDGLFRVRLGFEDKEKYKDLYYRCVDLLKQKDSEHVFKYKLPYIRTEPMPIDEAIELFRPLVAATYKEIKKH